MDCISRQNLKRLLTENAHWVTYNSGFHEKGLTLSKLIQIADECPTISPVEGISKTEANNLVTELIRKYYTAEEHLYWEFGIDIQTELGELRKECVELHDRFLNIPSLSREGRWETRKYPSLMFCSECGEPFEKREWNYCPNCGAVMGGNDG